MLRNHGIFRLVLCSLLLCAFSIATATVSLAEEETGSLKDNGVKEINSAYEFVIDTQKEGKVGASADMSFGVWSSLGSSLSYMKIADGSEIAEGNEGLWCYCLDITTDTRNGHKYSATTMDAGEYYGSEAAQKIRTALMNSYPYLSIEELEKRYGLTELSEEEAYIATQWFIWYYSNPDGLVKYTEDEYYSAKIYKPSEFPYESTTIWYDDENGNEISKESTNVVKLLKALDALELVKEYDTEPVELVIERRIYNDKAVFDFSNSKNLDALINIDISVKDGEGNEVPFTLSGNKIVVERTDIFKNEGSLQEDAAANLTVEIKGEQKLNEDVYFFAPEGGRDASQSRVAVYQGIVPVAAITGLGTPRSGFNDAPKDALIKVNKSVLLNGAAHRTEDIYYVALFEDSDCTKIAFNGDVREIKMGGESNGYVVFDELVPGKTYYVAETDAEGSPLKDGDMGIAAIAYDKQEATADAESVAEVAITNCYEDNSETTEESQGPNGNESEEESGGGIGSGDAGDSTNEEKSIDEAVDTGDNTNVMMLMAMVLLMTLAMIGAVSTMLFGRRA